MFKKILPIGVIILVTILVFRNFVFKGLLPIPADILIGAYYPWLDYKWGYSVGVPVKNPAPSDVISMLYPWRILGMEILKSGHLPLWDSTSLLGVPLLANFQAAILNPLNFLFWVFPNRIAWSLQVIVQPILIAYTTFLFLKNLGLQKVSAIFGGLTFAFSGFSIVWMEYNTIGYALAPFPLALLLVDKIAKEEKPVYAFLLGLLICLQIFAGYPQICIYTIFFVIIYFFIRLRANIKNWKFKLTLFIIGMINSFLLAAVQLLPSLELLKLSIRSFDDTAIAGGIKFLPFKHLLTLLIPDFFGNPATGNYWGLGSFDNFAFSISTVALFFVVIAVAGKIIFQKSNYSFLIMAVISLILATSNPLSNIISKLDLLGMKSAVATRVLFVFDFILVIWAAQGLEYILTNKMRSFFSIIPLAIYTSLAAGIIFSGILTDQGLVHLWSGQSNIAISFRNLLLPLVLIFLISLTPFFKKYQQLFTCFIFLLLVFNITKTTDKYLTFIPPHLLYPTTEVINELQDNLKEHRFDREKGEIFPSNTWIAYGLKAISGQNAIYPLLSSKYFALVNNTYPNIPNRFVDITNMKSSLYDTLDIKYLTVLKRNEKFAPDINGIPKSQFTSPKFKEYKDIKTVKILENTSNLGLAWFSANVVCIQTEQETANILMDENFNPAKTAIVDCSDNQVVNNAGMGQISIDNDIPNHTQLQINTPKTNFLIVSRAFYPGWQVLIGGVRQELYTANLALMAVMVPEGSHTIELKYQPDSFNLGIIITLVTFTTWFIYFGFAYVLNRYNKFSRDE